MKGEAAIEPGVPESFNVLIRELQSLCLDVELIKSIDEDGRKQVRQLVRAEAETDYGCTSQLQDAQLELGLSLRIKSYSTGEPPRWRKYRRRTPCTVQAHLTGQTRSLTLTRFASAWLRPKRSGAGLMAK